MRRWIALLLTSIAPLGAQEQTVAMLKTEVLTILPSLPGWCSREKAENFVDLVVHVKPKVCVEIGVFGGASAIPVALALKYLGAGVLYAIDPWDKLECIKGFDPVAEQKHVEWWSRVRLNHISIQFKAALQEYELVDHCIAMQMTSEKAANRIGAIDILYIDGNHSESSSSQDVALYLPKVPPGGYIWINDANCNGSRKIMPVLLQECDFVKAIDQGNCFLFRKRA